MKRRVWVFIMTALMLGTGGLTVWAGGIRSGRPEGPRAELVRRWNAMTPAERQVMRERMEKWRQMSSETRAKIHKNLDEFRQLPPERQRAMEVVRRRMMEMGPQERQRTREALARIGQLPPRERGVTLRRFMLSQDFLGQELRELKDAGPGRPPENMRRLRHRVGVLEQLPRETLDELRRMTPGDRRAALRKLWEENPMPARPLMPMRPPPGTDR